MRQALEQAWSPPTWVREARDRRIERVRVQQRCEARRVEAEREAKERQAIREAQEQDEALWRQIGAELEADSNVVAYAHTLATEEMGTAARVLVRPGSVLWRQMLLRAARDLGKLPVGEGAA